MFAKYRKKSKDCDDTHKLAELWSQKVHKSNDNPESLRRDLIQLLSFNYGTRHGMDGRGKLKE